MGLKPFKVTPLCIAFGDYEVELKISKMFETVLLN